MNRPVPPTMRIATALAATLATAAFVNPAAGTLTASGSPVEALDVSGLVGLAGLVDEFDGGEFDAGWNPAEQVLSLTGDANITVSPNSSRTFSFISLVVFQPIGLFPVQITPEVTADYKVAVAGGTLAEPGVTVYSSISISERGAFTTAGLNRTNPAFEDAGDHVFTGQHSFSRNGNGLLFGQDFDVDPFVLAPGVQYIALAEITLIINASDLAADDPASIVTLEAGGLSGYSGLSVDFNSTLVPEPASFATLAAAGLLLFRRRR